MTLGSDRPVFVISVAAELAGMHPQTLRQYDRMGLVQPSRAPGRARRYSQRDIEKLQEIQELSQAGVSLEGIKRIMSLKNQVEQMRAHMQDLVEQLQSTQQKLAESSRVFAAGSSGDIVHLSRGQRPSSSSGSHAVVLYRDRRKA